MVSSRLSRPQRFAAVLGWFDATLIGVHHVWGRTKQTYVIWASLLVFGNLLRSLYCFNMLSIIFCVCWASSMLTWDPQREQTYTTYIVPKSAPLPSRRAIFWRPDVAHGEFIAWKLNGTLFENGNRSHNGTHRNLIEPCMFTTHTLEHKLTIL